ncbi:TFIIF subunit [Heterostelium album PN500]|uniref:TFIIF subunit n=1 Tax=Heterostelium pallidum (strain ATCC 26659 / Pp 5 / PN500) TaxID=670386 RepID=D3B2E2_HETP5|nr:TFIIF subunit [Heterostelium album PN500]EFA84517.1 TFIIF subunit [Heterostelium album PN500]|eukprot:XP_020436630.1 TFIIF subunit [Heterostelium album PN500]
MSEDSNDALVGEINTDNVETQAWLIKVPKHLADHWMTAGGGTEIGKLFFKSSNNLSLSINFKDKENNNGYVPSEELQLVTTPLPDSNPIKIFSEDTENALSFEGSIGLRCDVRMDLSSPAYRELMKSRTTSYNTKTRQSKTIEANDRSQLHRVYSNPAKIAVSTTVYTKPKGKSQEDKRERMQEEDLIDLIFKAFGEKQYWLLKDLVAYTDQPQVWLKQTLEKICTLHKRGSHRNSYEIKPEYKTSTQPGAISSKPGL